MALPAVVLVLACALGAIELGGDQLRLQAATFEAARLVGRGDAGALATIRAVSADATMATRKSGDSVCVGASATVSLGFLRAITLRADACSLADAEA